ncbi:MAG: ROK family protein [Clostridia bacterium]|nr:ROK family protein [Clostridia bacterium]
MKKIGIDIGGTKIKIGIIENGNVISSEVINTPQDSFDSVAKVTTDKIKEMIGENSTISAAGIGTRGTFKNGCLHDLVLHADNVSVEDAFNKYLPDFKIKVTNDANAAAVAELKYGNLKGSKSGLFMTIGTGIGGGLIINGNLFEGANKNAGEIGTMIMNSFEVDEYSATYNTYESLASAKALIDRTKKILEQNPNSKIFDECDHDLNKLDAKNIFDAYDKGDELAKQLIDKHIEYIASGIINLIVTFDLDTIVIGGGVSKRHDILIPRIKKILDSKDMAILKNVKITNSTFLNEAGIIGAANLFDN